MMSSTETARLPARHPITRLRYEFDRLPRIVRYLIIGGSASALDVALFIVLFEFVGTSALVAHSISVPTSVVYSFITNARHNFKVTDRMGLRLASFAAVCAIGYGVGYGIIALAASFGQDEIVGKLLSLPVVFVIQYALNSAITFRQVERAA